MTDDFVDFTDVPLGSTASKATGLAIDLRAPEEHVEEYLETLEELPKPLDYLVEEDEREMAGDFFSPTHFTSQMRVPLRKSELIDRAADVFREAVKSLKAFGFRQVDLEKIEADKVDQGHLVEGRVIFTAETFPLGQPGANFSYESFPLRRRRFAIPLEVRGGRIYPPKHVIDPQQRVFDFSEEGLREAMQYEKDKRRMVRRRAPRVRRSWDIPRDYRAF